MDERQKQLKQWVLAQLQVAAQQVSWQPVPGDASTRRYFRVRMAAQSWIAADAPPLTENNEAFLRVRGLLHDAGARVPTLIATELRRGFMLQEDLGERLLLAQLDAATVDGVYRRAMAILLRIQGSREAAQSLPEYSAGVLGEELSRFLEWFWQGLLQQPQDATFRADWTMVEQALIASALEQPRVLVHRDFHSRNLLLPEQGQYGLIDFQDALYGPLCYDLVSLLRDCYVRWPADRVRSWALAYRRSLLDAGRPAGADEAQFLRWFDWIGLQRHLRVLGNFSRLALRDGRPDYLADVPLVLDYCLEVCRLYPELRQLAGWLQSVALPALPEAVARLQS